jgi:hypothetical protein
MTRATRAGSWALFLAACGSGPESPGVAPALREAAGSLVWRGPPVRLSVPGANQHHPTADHGPDGLLVAWWTGTRAASVAVRGFADSLAPLGPPVAPDGGDRQAAKAEMRATHPQVAIGPGGAWLAWTQDATGALRMARWTAPGVLGPSVDLVEGGSGRPAQFPDVSVGPDGRAWVVWYEGKEPEPAWRVGAVGGDGAVEGRVVPAAAGSDVGGPASIAHAPDGSAWVSWPEQELGWTPWSGRDARVRVGRVRSDGEVVDVRTVARGLGNWQRTALAFTAGGAAAHGWTAYPARGGDWSPWVTFEAQIGAPREPVRLGAGDGRMVDLDAAGDRVVVAWEEPIGEGWAIAVQVFDGTGAPLGEAALAHAPGGPPEERANVTLWEEGGQIEGALLWAAGPSGAAREVWGRRFSLRAGR